MLRLHSILFTAFLTILSCKVVQEDTQSNTQTTKTFEIANGEIQGWSFQTGWESEKFTATEMFGKVDGEAKEFVNGGLISGIAQRLQNDKSDPMEKMELWIMDFSTVDAASKIFQSYPNVRFTTQKEVAGFSKSVALIDDSSTEGCKAIIRFGQFVIFLNLTNYGEKSKSITDATELLKVFQSKQL